ncbi:MAG: TRAP transporter large permease subunit [Pseudomonadota bacterium]
MSAVLVPLAMITALCAFVAIGVPAAWGLAGVASIFAMIGIGISVIDDTFLLAIPARLTGSIISSQYLLAIPPFVLMGVIMTQSQLATRMATGVRIIFGSKNTLKSLLILGIFLAASTGIAAASVVMLAMLAWPIMQAANIHAKRLGLGLICAAGSLAQFIPPSLLLILLAEHINAAHLFAQNAQGNWAPDPVTIGHLFAGALVPGIILAGLYGLYLTLAKHSSTWHTFADEQKHATLTMVSAWFWGMIVPALLILSILGAILAGIATTTQAATLGVCFTIILAALAKDDSNLVRLAAPILLGCLVLFILSGFWGWNITQASGILVAIGVIGITPYLGKSLWQAIAHEAIVLVGMIFAIIICASVFVLVMKAFGGDTAIRRILQDLPGGAYGGVFVVVSVVFLLGCILDGIEIVTILVPVCAPVLLASGDISPIWLGVCLALALQSSYLTPPFGLAIIFARSVIPKSIAISEFYRAVWPFVGLQILLFLLLLGVPQIATGLPNLLYQ